MLLQLSACGLSQFIFHYAEETVLKIEDLPVLTQKLASVAYKWYHLGVQLRFNPNVLKGIQDPGSPNVSFGLTELLTKWLTRITPPPTLQSLVDAVGQEFIDNQTKAEQLKNECGDFPSIRGKRACTRFYILALLQYRSDPRQLKSVAGVATSSVQLCCIAIFGQYQSHEFWFIHQMLTIYQPAHQ